jgi:hypothetical protein
MLFKIRDFYRVLAAVVEARLISSSFTVNYVNGAPTT